MESGMTRARAVENGRNGPLVPNSRRVEPPMEERYAANMSHFILFSPIGVSAAR
jgi:hypothetical protein